jgi:hypothetical protein
MRNQRRVFLAASCADAASVNRAAEVRRATNRHAVKPIEPRVPDAGHVRRSPLRRRVELGLETHTEGTSK